MEAERKLKEKEEEERRLKEQTLKETFGDSQSEWEQDKAQMQSLESQRKADQAAQVPKAGQAAEEPKAGQAVQEPKAGQALQEPKGAAAKAADAAGGK
jgi:mannan polymerase II complex ANP1 subunit